MCSGSGLAITTIKFRAIFITFAASPHLSPPPSPRGHRDSSSCPYRSASSEHLRTQKGPGQHFHKQSTVCIIHTPISVPTPPPESELQGRDFSPNPKLPRAQTWDMAGVDMQELQAPKTANSLSHVEVIHKTFRKTVHAEARAQGRLGWGWGVRGGAKCSRSREGRTGSGVCVCMRTCMHHVLTQQCMWLRVRLEHV